jgi:hypothetical protein
MTVKQRPRSTLLGSKEITMNIKNIIKKAVVKEAAGKILPMDGVKPKLGPKAKLAGILATIAAVAGAASQYLGG